ncbi:MAG TPA: restriction endonuclease [Longimicrobium sp.]|jgi:restriction system protein
MGRFWMVRAGPGGYLYDDFVKLSSIAVAWPGSESLEQFHTLHEIREYFAGLWPEASVGSINAAASMAYKLRVSMQVGDGVVTYSPERREYLFGSIAGEYEHRPQFIREYEHVRKVSWKGSVSRDALSTPTKNALGSAWTIFEPGEEAEREILNGAAPNGAAGKSSLGEVSPERQTEDFELVREDAANRSHEFIKDRILKLSPDDMEQLTAAVLRAMGYKARVSPKGRDRGRDVVASPDGLGFVSPRIVSQVKHTKAATSGEDIRAFLGVLQTDDKALFVSTGGFSYDAKFEAERARFPVTLVDLDELANLVVEYYDKFDAEGRSLLPLIRIYWPA